MRLHGRYWAVVVAVLSSNLVPSLTVGAGELATKDAKWCTMTCPKAAKPGERFTITVAYRGLPAGTHLHCDLKTASHAMMQWNRPVKVTGDGKHNFSCRAKMVTGNYEVYALVFCTKNGNWNTNFNVTSTPRIALLGDDGEPAKAEARPYVGKSWLAIDPDIPAQVKEGETFEVKVHYYLDPDEAVDGEYAFLSLTGLGPWLDNVERRRHINYPGTSGNATVKVGKGTHTFKLTGPTPKRHNSLQFMAFFYTDAASPWGSQWPGSVRASGPRFSGTSGFFGIETDRPGNLFLYDEPVVMRIVLRDVRGDDVGKERVVRYKVHDHQNTLVAEGEKSFAVEKRGQVIPVELKVDSRGTFRFAAEVFGRKWEKRETMFCRIPDVLKTTGGKRTAFGATNFVGPGSPDRIEANCQIAQKLGLTICRTFSSWYSWEVTPGQYVLDRWEDPIDLANKYGVDVYLELQHPPVWARQPAHVRSWAAPPKWEMWENLVRAIATRFKGRIYAYEWLNEICPGGWWKGTAEEYVKLCQIGTATVKSIDPKARTTFAGGLWPRSFRLGVLAAGGGRYVDTIPVHYSDGAGIREAREDAASYGAALAAWDNESARGVTMWEEPYEKDLVNTVQSAWLLRRWPDELMAGAERIIWFGFADCCGNWAPFYEDFTPRPVVATLAVFVSKLHGATPLGVFSAPDGGVFHLFERDGKPLLIARSNEKATVSLNVGVPQLKLTDCQGNESTIEAADGVAQLSLGPMAQYIEGGGPDVLKAYVLPALGAKVRYGHACEADLAPERIGLLAGGAAELPVRVRNLYDRPLKGEITVVAPKGWPASAAVPFRIEPKKSVVTSLALRAPKEASGEAALTVAFRFKSAELPQVSRRVMADVLSPDMLGNLVKNGDVESDADADGVPDSLALNGKDRIWAETKADGTGQRCIKLVKPLEGRWNHCGFPGVPVIPGRKYLYTAWVWSQGMTGGSNLWETYEDGHTRNYTEPKVFGLSDTPYWRLYTKVWQAPAGIKTVGPVPVVSGSGFALYDNVRITLYRGSVFAAECHKTTRPIKIDGDLSDWVTKCPIPLIGTNQLKTLRKDYEWSPENLSAVGYLMWDDANLYLALKVRDDKHHRVGDDWTGEGVTAGDSIQLAFDPTQRGLRMAGESFALQLARSSGRSHVILRPKDRSGGLQAGQLYRDSSVFELACQAFEGGLLYELRLPYSQLGSLKGSIGRTVGMSILINDNDGRGKAAEMFWGQGLSSVFQPAQFGCLTFVE